MSSGLIALGLIPILLIWFGGVHRVEEGHVGIYYRGGALIDGYTEPGFHFMLPFFTEFHNI